MIKYVSKIFNLKFQAIAEKTEKNFSWGILFGRKNRLID